MILIDRRVRLTRVKYVVCFWLGLMLDNIAEFQLGYHGWIQTLEGGHIVTPGDWIITGVAGEQYPCKPDIFAATYEEVK